MYGHGIFIAYSNSDVLVGMFKFYQVFAPFEDYFSVDALQVFHRVITMETFMTDIAPVVWPYQKRFSEFSRISLAHAPAHYICLLLDYHSVFEYQLVKYTHA